MDVRRIRNSEVQLCCRELLEYLFSQKLLSSKLPLNEIFNKTFLLKRIYVHKPLSIVIKQPGVIVCVNQIYTRQKLLKVDTFMKKSDHNLLFKSHNRVKKIENGLQKKTI